MGEESITPQGRDESIWTTIKPGPTSRRSEALRAASWHIGLRNDTCALVNRGQHLGRQSAPPPPREAPLALIQLSPGREGAVAPQLVPTLVPWSWSIMEVCPDPRRPAAWSTSPHSECPALLILFCFLKNQKQTPKPKSEWKSFLVTDFGQIPS